MPSQPVLLGNVAAVRRLQLRPLSRNAVATIVGDSGIDPDRLFATTAGNPFFVAEVLATGGKNIPPTVRDAVLARAAQFTPPARLVLEAAAVVTPPVETWLLAEVAGCALQLIDECVAAGMLQARPERLELRHELARMAVEDSVALRRQRGLDMRHKRKGPGGNHARLSTVDRTSPFTPGVPLLFTTTGCGVHSRGTSMAAWLVMNTPKNRA
jgi:hypothetical protein